MKSSPRIAPEANLVSNGSGRCAKLPGEKADTSVMLGMGAQ